MKETRRKKETGEDYYADAKHQRNTNDDGGGVAVRGVRVRVFR